MRIRDGAVGSPLGPSTAPLFTLGQGSGAGFSGASGMSSIHAASRAQVDELTAEVRARGLTILYGDRHPYAGGPEYYALFSEDPDWSKVELVASE